MTATKPFDAAPFMTAAEDQQMLLSYALTLGDETYIAHALDIIARAQDEVAKAPGG
jgi:DNA-binding phage protein